MAEIQSVPCLMPLTLFDASGQERQVGWYEYSNGTNKPVYQKEFTGIRTSSTSDVVVNITSLNIDKVVLFYGTARYERTSTRYPLPAIYVPSAGGSGVQGIQITVSPSEIRIRPTTGGWGDHLCNVIVQYTKTTDVAA